MAELLVRIEDRVNPDFYLDCGNPKRGDVICVQPDGWEWGTEEVKNPTWRIIKFPGIDPSDLSALIQPEIDIDPKNPSKTLQRRAFKLDLDELAKDKNFDTFLKDPTRTTTKLDVSKTLVEILPLQKLKPTIQDPAIFGASPNTF